MLLQEGIGIIEKVLLPKTIQQKLFMFQHNYDDIHFGVSIPEFRKMTEHLFKILGK